MTKLRIRPHYNCHIKVSRLTLHPDVSRRLREQNLDPTSYTNQMAQYVEMFISTYQGIPLIPYTKGEAIGGKMTARFVNGNIYELAFPSPDYIIETRIGPFKLIKSEKPNYTQYGFASFIRFRFYQPDSGNVYMDSIFRNIPIVTVDKSFGIVLDQWQEFQKSVRSLLVQLSKQISIRDESWFSRSTRGDNLSERMEKIESILEKCR